jgi:methionyl-tRNA formyltransferase
MNNNALQIVYFGTPDFSALLLERILDDHDVAINIATVVTQPPKKVGRKQILTPSPVERLANKRGIPVVYSHDELSLAYDLGLVFAYSKILPDALLKQATHGYWNIHPSMLPAYRGPSPVAWALVDGATSTGCTLMQMDAQMDHGPIIAQEQTYIFPQERRSELTGRLVKLGHKLLRSALIQLVEMSSVDTIAQDHAQATYSKLLRKQDGYVEKSIFSTTGIVSRALYDKWRAYDGWPGIWTMIDHHDKPLRVKITQMHMEEDQCRITHVQLEGKNEVPFAQFRQAYPQALDAEK